MVTSCRCYIKSTQGRFIRIILSEIISWEEQWNMEGRVFYKLVCVDESDPLEYQIFEDINCGCLEEVHEYVTKNIGKHKNAKWMLLPFST